jgi:hypothetical protein
MSGSPGSVEVFVALTPIVAGRELPLQDHLRSLPPGPGSPLANVPGTHFGRWLVIRELVYEGPPQRPDSLKSQYLLFSACYDTPLLPWLDRLERGLGDEAEAIWGNCVGFAGGGLKYYLLHNQLTDMALFYRGYSASVEEVRASLRRRRRIHDFILEHEGAEDARLVKEWRETFGGGDGSRPRAGREAEQ